MLIEFSVTNFRSIRDRQTFSLVKAKGDELMDSNTIQTGALNKVSLLRTAVIYGPNAGGKSISCLRCRSWKKSLWSQ